MDRFGKTGYQFIYTSAFCSKVQIKLSFAIYLYRVVVYLYKCFYYVTMPRALFQVTILLIQKSNSPVHNAIDPLSFNRTHGNSSAILCPRSLHTAWV